MPHLSAPRLDTAVTGRVREILSDPTVLRSAVGGRVSMANSPAVALADVRAEQRELDQKVADEGAMLREVGLRKEALVAALAPLRKRQDELEIQARSLERQMKVAAGGSVDRVVQQAVDALKDGFEFDDPAMWRTVLTLIGTRVTVEGHRPCRLCEGSPKVGWGKQCQGCLNGTEPIIDIEVDDALALAVSQRLAAGAGA